MADAFLDAFLATFTLDLRFTAWIQTLESTKEQRIVLLNPWASLPLTGGTIEARIALRYFDLLGHEYPEILVAPLRVESDGTGLLPAFEIIEVASRLETKSLRARRGG